jgi:selenide, water dikinase
VLRPVKGLFDSRDYPDLLVGLDQPDDAAVWRLDDSRALVLTTDFFTPVVDDPFAYGSIAAANSLSDIYAMGGVPFMALNIAAVPPQLDPDITAEIIRGAAEKAKEAGVVVAGGHTVQDKEPKFGLVVAGFVDPRRSLTKAGARPGDRLVLTKPLGFGVTTTALKREIASDADVAEVTAWMQQLNRAAAQLAVDFELRGGTDVTGFSLLGHGLEIAQASNVSLHLAYSRIPFLTCAHKYAQQWAFPGGASDNCLFYGPHVQFSPAIDEASQMLLFDPQTSGGLLLAVPPQRLDAFLAAAQSRALPVWEIGEVAAGSGIQINEI